MQPYKNISGDSGVVAYGISPDAITIRFRDGDDYIYNYASAGRLAVEKMKELASAGRGLATYINRNVRIKYAHKLTGK